MEFQPLQEVLSEKKWEQTKIKKNPEVTISKLQIEKPTFKTRLDLDGVSLQDTSDLFVSPKDTHSTITMNTHFESNCKKTQKKKKNKNKSDHPQIEVKGISEYLY